MADIIAALQAKAWRGIDSGGRCRAAGFPDAAQGAGGGGLDYVPASAGTRLRARAIARDGSRISRNYAASSRFPKRSPGGPLLEWRRETKCPACFAEIRRCHRTFCAGDERMRGDHLYAKQREREGTLLIWVVGWNINQKWERSDEEWLFCWGAPGACSVPAPEPAEPVAPVLPSIDQPCSPDIWRWPPAATSRDREQLPAGLQNVAGRNFANDDRRQHSATKLIMADGPGRYAPRRRRCFRSTGRARKLRAAVTGPTSTLRSRLRRSMPTSRRSSSTRAMPRAATCRPCAT